MILSDNAATDVILREVGGTDAVMARLRSLGIEGVRAQIRLLRLLELVCIRERGTQGIVGDRVVGQLLDHLPGPGLEFARGGVNAIVEVDAAEIVVGGEHKADACVAALPGGLPGPFEAGPGRAA